MTVNYITLTNSDESQSFKFRVVEGGYNIAKEKAQTENATIGGLDVAMGAIHESHEYVLKIHQSRTTITTSGSYISEEEDFGVLSDLEYFYSLNNPKATPSNIITLTDHFGADHEIYFVGAFDIRPATVFLENFQALFFIPVKFRVIPNE